MAMGCGGTVIPETLPPKTIRIVEPAAGATFALDEGVSVIVECEYAQFTSGITIEFSTDSARTWQFLQSLARKEGTARDTLSWVPARDTPGEVAPGGGVLVRAHDYDKKFSDQSGFFFISP